MELLAEDIRPDRSLAELSLDKLDTIRELKHRFVNEKTSVCIERAIYLTESMRATEGEPMIIRRAKGLANYLSKRSIIFHDSNMLGGATTSKPLGAPVYPETLGMAIWPELEVISDRKNNPQQLTDDEAEVLNFQIFPYWMDRTVLEVARAKGEADTGISLMERLVYFMAGKSSVISHTTPYYVDVLDKGLLAMIDDAKARCKACADKGDDDGKNFYEAMQICMQGIIDYATHISEAAAKRADQAQDAKEKANFRAIADACANVPAKPAASFREAVNCIWICHVAILAENTNMAIGPGRVDQILYPFYKKDVDAGKLSTREALELICCLWLKLADNTNLVPESAEKLFGGAGSVPAVTLGGVDMDGNDAVNDLTYIALRATEMLCIKDPNVNARFHKDVNEKAYRDRVSEVVMNTRAIPAFFNDSSNIDTLVNQGVSLEHARDYAVIGCVELASAGREYSSSSSILLNLNSAVDLALYNGRRPYFSDEMISFETGDPTTFETYEQFWDAFAAQLTWLMQQAVDTNECLGRTHQELIPTPLLSSFFDGPMESGKDLIFGGARYNSSGTTHIAFADTCDSLNAIEQAVFIDKKFTMQQMIDAVSKDFAAPYDTEMLPYLQNKAPKYGTDNPVARRNAKRMVELIYEFWQSRTNYRDGKYRPAYWTMTNHAGQGTIAGALPSGRKAGEVFSSGITPASQAAQDLTGAFLAVADLGHKNIPGAVALNMKYSPVTDTSNGHLDTFGGLIDGYFSKGGMQVQFNIQDYNTLIDARKHKEKYHELIVRVSGYSAYFKDLNEAMMDELITRTQYDMNSGKAVPLPSTFHQGE